MFLSFNFSNQGHQKYVIKHIQTSVIPVYAFFYNQAATSDCPWLDLLDVFIFVSPLSEIIYTLCSPFSQS